MVLLFLGPSLEAANMQGLLGMGVLHGNVCMVPCRAALVLWAVLLLFE